MGSFAGTHSQFIQKKMLFFIASLMKIKSYRSHNPYQVVQESCMHTTPEHALKLKVRKIKSISQYQTVRGKYHLFVAVGISAHAAAAHSNITDNNNIFLYNFVLC